MVPDCIKFVTTVECWNDTTSYRQPTMAIFVFKLSPFFTRRRRGATLRWPFDFRPPTHHLTPLTAHWRRRNATAREPARPPEGRKGRTQPCSRLIRVRVGLWIGLFSVFASLGRTFPLIPGDQGLLVDVVSPYDVTRCREAGAGCRASFCTPCARIHHTTPVRRGAKSK